jgi:hypothetical protein
MQTHLGYNVNNNYCNASRVESWRAEMDHLDNISSHYFVHLWNPRRCAGECVLTWVCEQRTQSVANNRSLSVIFLRCIMRIVCAGQRVRKEKSALARAKVYAYRRARGSAHTIYFNYARRVLAKYITIHGRSAQFLNMLGWRNFTFARGVCIIGFVWESASQISKSANETETESCVCIYLRRKECGARFVNKAWEN